MIYLAGFIYRLLKLLLLMKYNELNSASNLNNNEYDNKPTGNKVNK